MFVSLSDTREIYKLVQNCMFSLSEELSAQKWPFTMMELKILIKLVERELRGI